MSTNKENFFIFNAVRNGTTREEKGHSNLFVPETTRSPTEKDKDYWDLMT